MYSAWHFHRTYLELRILHGVGLDFQNSHIVNEVVETATIIQCVH